MIVIYSYANNKYYIYNEETKKYLRHDGQWYSTIIYPSNGYWISKREAQEFLKEYIKLFDCSVSYATYQQSGEGYFIGDSKSTSSYYLTKTGWDTFSSSRANEFSFKTIEEAATYLLKFNPNELFNKNYGKEQKMIAIETPIEAMNQHIQEELFKLGFVRQYSKEPKVFATNTKFVIINDLGNVDGRDSSIALKVLPYSEFLEEAKKIADSKNNLVLNEYYTASVTKSGVHVGCQTFSLDSAITLGKIAERVKMGSGD